MKSNFNTVFENVLERYQQGGYVIGDRVRFIKDCLKHEFFSNKGQSFIDLVKGCMATDFDLNLRISAVKSVYPNTAFNYRGGAESPDCIYVDIMVEYAPGLWRTPMTVPIDVIEKLEDGINTSPIPDSLRRKSKVHGPEEIQAKSEAEFDVNLQNKNVVPKFSSKKRNDQKPSKEWEPLPTSN
jgi:hypothetical protein